MRNAILCAWLLLPVAAGAYHYGPGQARLRDDRIEAAVHRADAMAGLARAKSVLDGEEAAKAQWTEAELAYTEALQLAGNDHPDVTRSLRLERAKAQMFCSKLPDARKDLETLLDDLSQDPDADPKLVDDTRGALANAQYYTTWLMRLEGAPREEWEPEIEASRQNYKLLAENAEHAGAKDVAKKAAEDLESAVRLERMELTDLQGLPLPSQ
jgi:hypothetical protein